MAPKNADIAVFDPVITVGCVEKRIGSGLPMLVGGSLRLKKQPSKPERAEIPAQADGLPLFLATHWGKRSRNRQPRVTGWGGLRWGGGRDETYTEPCQAAWLAGQEASTAGG